MLPEIESYSPLEVRPGSPLRQAMFGRDQGDLDSWLAGMNAVGLSFLLIAAGAFLPSATASRLHPEAPLPPPAEGMEVEMVADPGPPPAAAAEPETAAETLAEPEPESEDLPPLPEPAVYREMPEMIDPVPVVEPERRVQEPRRPPFKESRPPATSAPRQPAAASQNTTAASGVAGGLPGGAATSQRTAGNSGRGTTPQPPYPAFARRD
jgi:protein TonB